MRFWSNGEIDHIISFNWLNADVNLLSCHLCKQSYSIPSVFNVSRETSISNNLAKRSRRIGDSTL